MQMMRYSFDLMSIIIIQQNYLPAFVMFKIMPKEEYEALTKLSKINFLALETLENTLDDQVTISTYIKAMKQNKHFIENKVVLQLTNGCNCLYSIHAAHLNASKVYCVINGHSESQTRNIYMMKEIIKENGYDQLIEVMSYKDFNVRVDAIIGQPMGYNLIYDGMIDRMIEARDLFLNEGGIMMPDIIKYKCAFIRDDHFKDHKVSFWDEVYGIPMKTMKKWISSQPVVRIVDPTLVVSDITKFLQFNLHTTTYEQIDDISRKFKINSLSKTSTEQPALANGLCVWFEVQFNKGQEKVQIKASPWSEATRWTHMTLYVNKFWQLNGGQNKKIEFIGKKSHLQGTSTIKLKVQGVQDIYHFA